MLNQRPREPSWVPTRRLWRLHRRSPREHDIAGARDERSRFDHARVLFVERLIRAAGKNHGVARTDVRPADSARFAACLRCPARDRLASMGTSCRNRRNWSTVTSVAMCRDRLRSAEQYTDLEDAAWEKL